MIKPDEPLSEQLIKTLSRTQKLMESVGRLSPKQQSKFYKDNDFVRKIILSAFYSDFLNEKYGFDDRESRLDMYYDGLMDTLSSVDSEECKFYNDFEYSGNEDTKEEFRDYAHIKFEEISSDPTIPKSILFSMSASTALMGLAGSQLLDNSFDDSLYHGLIGGLIPTIGYGLLRIVTGVKNKNYWRLMERDIEEKFEDVINYCKSVELILHARIVEDFDKEKTHQLIKAWDDGDDDLVRKLNLSYQ